MTAGMHMLMMAPIESGALSDIGMGLVLTLVGMGVVFVTLATIMLLVALLEKIVGNREAPAPAATAPEPGVPAAAGGDAGVGALAVSQVKASDTAPSAGMDDEITPELVAVIAAAATVVLNRHVRVRSVALVGSTTGSAWLAGGRTRLMGSHRPVRRQGH